MVRTRPAFFLSTLAGLSRTRLFCMHKWHINKMLAQKPYLQFVTAQHIAHRRIVGAVVAKFRGAARQLPTISDDDLVRVEQAGNLTWHFFPAARGTLDPRVLGDIRRHGD